MCFNYRKYMLIIENNEVIELLGEARKTNIFPPTLIT